jgi:double-stranded uracil-DNA glycosylase
VLLVGINPGVRSAQTGHHFAGHSNRFWKLLHESGLVPALLASEQDHDLPTWGFGLTNLVPRPTPGIGDLKPEEYRAGRAALFRKIGRYRPEVVAFIGVTLYRALFRVKTVRVGPQADALFGARVFVLPNPSGRNANFTYAEMLSAFRELKRALSPGP